MSVTPSSSPELLLPVGNLSMCLAAIHNGADAVYIGAPGFNARGRSVDHTLEELKEMVNLCHLYGVKVHLAFNVLIFEEEIPKIIELLQGLLPLGVDAFIVQDIGLARLIHSMDPEQRIHASTQMTVTNHEAMELLQDLPFDRFVLGREVSIPEIKLIKEKTSKELEVFVHGALCVAYSGQCFTSESIGGRSANRGQCAQSCRLDYELFVDGEKKDLGEKRYLLSPQDLCGLEEVPTLRQLGVESLKVEGRLKAPEYVAACGQSYKKVLSAESADVPIALDQETREKLALTYSRGFYSGWLNGTNHQKLVEGSYSAHRGLYLGPVRKVSSQSIWVESSTQLGPGDGLLFILAGQKELGGSIYEVLRKDKNIFELTFSRDFPLPELAVGTKVFKNSDPHLEKELKQSWLDRSQQKHIPLRAVLSGGVGRELTLVVHDDLGNQVEITGVQKLEKAKTAPYTSEEIRKELGALTGTCFVLQELQISLDGPVFVPNKELKHLRKKATANLTERRIHRPQRKLLQSSQALCWYQELTNKHKAPAASALKPKLNILLRERAQVEDLCAYFARADQEWSKEHLGVVYLDFEFGKEYGPSVELLKSQNLRAFVATTRILKPREYHNFRLIERSNPDGILVRNLGALHYFQDKVEHLKGDFSLNVTNSLTAQYLMEKGLESVCASLDLNHLQLLNLANQFNAQNLEVILHQYMPLFHMEHCVFAAFLSKGSTFRDCGKPCEKHRVEMKDAYGNFHFLKADQECRNTVYNGLPQSAVTPLKQWRKVGLSEFRFEALFERQSELWSKLELYFQLLVERIGAEEAFQKLGVMEKYGVGQGQLLNTQKFQNRKKERPL